MRKAAWPLVASVVLVGLLFLFVFPTRTYIGQRNELDAAEQRVQVLSKQNEELASRVKRLNTDEEIERLAREQYNLVKPGEEAYAILPPPQSAEPPAEPAPKKKGKRGVVASVLDRITFWS